MSKKAKKKDQAKLALRRLAEDEEVQAQLRTAAIRAREAWGRAARRPGAKAVEDKKLYDKIREAATSLSQAGRKLRREPEPPKHRGRKAALAAASAGGAAYALRKRRDSSTGNGATATSSPDAEGPQRVESSSAAG
jgi:hypothetical protein